MLKNEEYNGGLSRKFDNKWDTEEAINILNNRLYYKVAISGKKNVIIIMWDRLTKIVYFVATTEGISAKGLARFF